MLEKKSGQFYMIAAVILSAIVIGISVIPNYSIRAQNFDFYDMKEEINIEAAKTMDYGTKSKYNSIQMNLLMQSFTQEYIKKRLKGESLYFIFGNKDNITVMGFQQENKTLSIESGGVPLVITQNPGQFIGSINPATNILTLKLNGNSFQFAINEGENFYYLLTQSLFEEEYLTTG